MFRVWPDIRLTPADRDKLMAHLTLILSQEQQSGIDRSQAIEANLASLKGRRARLTDALVDGILDKVAFDERMRVLVEDERSFQDRLQATATDDDRERSLVEEVFELCSSPQQSYILGDSGIRRELALRLCSNRTVAGNDISVEPYFPLRILATRSNCAQCDHHRTAARTFCKDPTGIRAVWRLYSWAKRIVKRQAVN
jgi:hypothetical protein